MSWCHKYKNRTNIWHSESRHMDDNSGAQTLIQCTERTLAMLTGAEACIIFRTAVRARIRKIDAAMEAIESIKNLRGVTCQSARVVPRFLLSQTLPTPASALITRHLKALRFLQHSLCIAAYIICFYFTWCAPLDWLRIPSSYASPRPRCIWSV